MPMNSKSNLNEPLTLNAIHILISQQHDVSQLEIAFDIGRIEETKREQQKKSTRKTLITILNFQIVSLHNQEFR